MTLEERPVAWTVGRGRGDPVPGPLRVAVLTATGTLHVLDDKLETIWRRDLLSGLGTGVMDPISHVEVRILEASVSMALTGPEAVDAEGGGVVVALAVASGETEHEPEPEEEEELDPKDRSHHYDEDFEDASDGHGEH